MTVDAETDNAGAGSDMGIRTHGSHAPSQCATHMMVWRLARKTPYRMW
jgi:hypothetical protein